MRIACIVRVQLYYSYVTERKRDANEISRPFSEIVEYYAAYLTRLFDHLCLGMLYMRGNHLTPWLYSNMKRGFLTLRMHDFIPSMLSPSFSHAILCALTVEPFVFQASFTITGPSMHSQDIHYTPQNTLFLHSPLSSPPLTPCLAPSPMHPESCDNRISKPGKYALQSSLQAEQAPLCDARSPHTLSPLCATAWYMERACLCPPYSTHPVMQSRHDRQIGSKWKSCMPSDSNVYPPSHCPSRAAIRAATEPTLQRQGLQPTALKQARTS